MDTLCGQVYGAGMYSAMGIVLQRAVLVCLVMGLPSYVLWWQAERVLLLLGERGGTVCKHPHRGPGVKRNRASYCTPCLIGVVARRGRR